MAALLSFIAVLFLFIVPSIPLSLGDQSTEKWESCVVEPVAVYYINLSRRQDRQQHMQAELKRHGLAPPKFVVHRFEAIDGLTHSFTPEEKALFRTFDETVGFKSPHNTNLLKSNSLSHLGVWKQVLESNVPYAVVFQDDVQLSHGFVDELFEIIVNNPSDAIVTWLGVNGYASGSVSRSAPLDAKAYDTNQLSTVVPSTNEKVGQCRPNLISTNSLAYLVTRHGAQILVDEFGNPDTGIGWTHHTDHAMVEFLDRRGVSYISRKILATTHDDGILGSDIFTGNAQEEAATGHAEAMVKRALRFARMPTAQAVSMAAKREKDKTDFQLSQSKIAEEPWLEGLTVRCEEMSCFFPDCPSPVITYAVLSWNSNRDGECLVDNNGSCNGNEEDMQIDGSGVRRHRGLKRLVIKAAAADVTPALAAEAIPAWWVLESWASGNYNAPHMPRPRFAKGDTVDVNFSSDSIETKDQWESAVVVALGYRDPSWAEGTVATYVVNRDGRFFTVQIDIDTKIRTSSTGTRTDDNLK